MRRMEEFIQGLIGIVCRRHLFLVVSNVGWRIDDSNGHLPVIVKKVSREQTVAHVPPADQGVACSPVSCVTLQRKT